MITLAKNKLNIIETLMSQALTDFAISHEEFSKIINEKIKYEVIKENIIDVKNIIDINDTENTALNKENNQVTNL